MKRTSIFATTFFLASALAGGIALGADFKVKLSGDNEVPPVSTSAGGEGTITIADDGKISGSITTHGIDGTMAHVHIAGAGKNGPVIVKMIKDGDTYKVPADAHLDAAQMSAFKAGELYINVHSANHKGGEIRGQLK